LAGAAATRRGRKGNLQRGEEGDLGGGLWWK